MPPVRVAVFRHLRAKVNVAQFQMGAGPAHRGPARPGYGPGDIIDGDFEEVKPDNDPTKPSGWVEGPKRH